TQQAAINDISICIAKNTTVGFVGTTGSGKTTTVDIILGLLTPSIGQLEIDGEPLSLALLNRWQQNLGYVPQSIYLTDDSVMNNIAIGVPLELINEEAVVRAAKLANLHDFITQEMAQGYNTCVGEGGIRLSGGQRQRIGIARALYHDPEVLIFDEATSALDGETEQVIIKSLKELAKQKTIIIIAHRLTTVKDCDCIYFFEKGKIIDQGTFADLASNNSKFRKIANLA
ncbi:MAG TPA: ATP-binding cassette domain-containing protein, partial [Candidatus Berkiella sp.]|nr:ATP-binding cassette domain-containing protein [Candidatus Berkiella sp.]